MLAYLFDQKIVSSNPTFSTKFLTKKKDEEAMLFPIPKIN
jgi:hypothetical protein